MLICLEKGHVFEPGGERRWTEPHGEPMAGCPECGGAFTEAAYCRNCYNAFLEEDLYSGLCEGCLREAVTFETFREYLCDTDAGGQTCAAGLRHFVFEKLLDSSVPAKLGDGARNALLMVYNAQENDPAFPDRCREYVMTDDGECGRNDYAAWLERRRRQHDREGIPGASGDQPFGAVADERESGEVQILPRASA